ncbi:MAG: hypothetical protein WCC84_13945 [Candidatus Cybelea sp.]
MLLSLAVLPVYITVLILVAFSIKILREYERAVVFRQNGAKATSLASNGTKMPVGVASGLS